MKGIPAMASERQHLDVSHSPELLRVAQEVKQTRTRRILQADGEELAEIKPMTKRSRLPRGKRTGAADRIWNIIGMMDSSEPDNISARVDEYLVEAELAQNHQP